MTAEVRAPAQAGVGTARAGPRPAAVPDQPATESDVDRAVRAWCGGELLVAIESADRALAEGTDPDGRAAGVAAAAAAADGALTDAVARWRSVAAAVEGSARVAAGGRAALAAALTGHLDDAAAELAAARRGLATPAPRGLSVLLDGVDAVLDAVRGDLAGSAPRLAGLAATTVPPDAFAVQPWAELAVEVVAAGGDDVGARAMLDPQDGPSSPRRFLLAAWFDLRAGRLAEARAGLAAAAARPSLRRNAVLAAAVTVGLARRCGDASALAATWHRVAPVVAGAEVELLQLDVWGELSTAAAAVSPAAAEIVAAAMAAAVARAGHPGWAVQAGHWWRLQRAIVTVDGVGAAAAAEALAGGPQHLATAARAWAAVLAAGIDPTEPMTIDPAAMQRAGAGLVHAGRPWEAAALWAAAAARTTDPGATRELLCAVRALRGPAAPERNTGRDGLSCREREVGLLVLDGLTQREIGARLYISPKTVEQHVARLRQKLAAANRAELVAGLRARLGAAG